MHKDSFDLTNAVNETKGDEFDGDGETGELVISGREDTLVRGRNLSQTILYI